MRTLVLIVSFLTIVGCNSGGSTDPDPDPNPDPTTNPDTDPNNNPDPNTNPDPTDNDTFRGRMRTFVRGISTYAKDIDPDFFIIPQNGQDVLSDNSNPNDTPNQAYLDAIDGIGREDLFYGYDNDDEPTASGVSNEIIAFLNIYENNDVQVLVTDYTSTNSRMDDSYSRNAALGYTSFAAPNRELDIIPDYPARPVGESNANISSLDEAKNFLYLLNPSNFNSKSEYLSSIDATNYDLFIIDAQYEGEFLSAADVQGLKSKANGGTRKIVAYMSIGEAEDYRYYWQPSWSSQPPSWVESENPEFQGNFIVQYWNAEWQSIIYGNDTSYLKKILDAGFDGVYLDIIDAFEFFE